MLQRASGYARRRLAGVKKDVTWELGSRTGKKPGIGGQCPRRRSAKAWVYLPQATTQRRVRCLRVRWRSRSFEATCVSNTSGGSTGDKNETVDVSVCRLATDRNRLWSKRAQVILSDLGDPLPSNHVIFFRGRRIARHGWTPRSNCEEAPVVGSGASVESPHRPPLIPSEFRGCSLFITHQSGRHVQRQCEAPGWWRSVIQVQLSAHSRRTSDTSV